LTTSAESTKGV